MVVKNTTTVPIRFHLAMLERSYVDHQCVLKILILIEADVYNSSHVAIWYLLLVQKANACVV